MQIWIMVVLLMALCGLTGLAVGYALGQDDPRTDEQNKRRNL